MSTATQKARCVHFGACGGCSRQDLPYEQQLANKEQLVRQKLENLTVGNFHPILPSPDIFYFRNKMEYSFGDERDVAIFEGKPLPTLPIVKHGEESFPPMSPNGGTKGGNAVHLGLHPKGRFALAIPTPDCLLLSEESQRVCQLVADWANEHKISVYVRKNGKGDLRHLVVREGKNTGERMVVLVSKSTTPHIEALAEKLRASGLVTTFIWSAYDGLSDVARGGKEKIYFGDGWINERLGGVGLRVNPMSFMQTNTHAAEMMIEVLKGWIRKPHPTLPTVQRGEEKLFPPMSHNGGTKGDNLIDLYCGSGAIGLCLADKFEKVVGVEINPEAVADAKRTAEANNLKHVEFMAGKAEDLAPQLPVKENAQNTMVVVDPPRPGLHPTMAKTLLEWSVPQILYVSCNPETLARDLLALSAKYDILDVQPMDFFPHTDHIETAVRLQLR